MSDEQGAKWEEEDAEDKRRPLEWVSQVWDDRAGEAPRMTLLAQVAAGPTAAACKLARLCMRVDDATLLVFHLEMRQRGLAARRGSHDDGYDSLCEALKVVASHCDQPFMLVTEQGGGVVRSVERFTNDDDDRGHRLVDVEPLTKRRAQKFYDRGELVVLYDPSLLKTVVAFWSVHHDAPGMALDADRRTDLFLAYVPPPHALVARYDHDGSPKSVDDADVFAPAAPPPAPAASVLVANPTTDALLRRARRALG